MSDGNESELERISHLHRQQIARYDLVNGDLKLQLDALKTELKSKTTQLNILEQLRKANQNLVIAAVDAQTNEDKAAADNLRQEQFLPMLAHELRNPLAPIVLATESIGKITDAHVDLPQLHAIISRQVDHMARLVDDLLDASRIATGKINVRHTILSLTDIAESSLEASRHLFEQRHQTIDIKLPTMEIVIHGDLVRLTQVFTNLLINASKFTPEFGAISVAISQLEEFAIICVKDDGMGIPLHLQGHIFDLFAQGFDSTNRSQGGLGIGLSLAKAIVEMHGGSIDAFSMGAGFGSKFIVRLPISSKPVATKPIPEKRAALRHKYRILVIEDNTDSNAVLSNLLMKYGHDVSSVFDGITGLSRFNGSPFDLIICDIGLPDMTGYELVRLLHAQLRRPLPVLVALSGYNRSAPLPSEQDFDHYLVKPIKFQMVLDILDSLADPTRTDKL
ncbi:signal transduction histidine kinase/ActR/RegA family two-component response regulator [Oxalobacteraceae bacterium GrIS 2.11]